MSERITVLLADDHALVRRGFRRILEDDPSIAVVGEVPLARLFHAVPAFPTRSEIWLYLLEALGIAGPCGGPQRS